MLRYLTRRVLDAVLVVLGVSLIIFVLVRLTPGDPIRAYLGETATDEQVAFYRAHLGLDQPLPVQYLRFLQRAMVGDLGNSLFYHRPATDVVGSHLPATLLLSLAALVISLVVAIPLGVLSAVRRDSFWDYLGMFVAMIGQSVPAFFLGLVLMLLFAVEWQVLPTAGYGTWQHLVLPSVTLAAFLVGLLTRMVRSGMLEVLGEDYVRTARAKGLSERSVLYQHAFRNMAIPLVTIIGLQFGTLLGGAIVVETVFSWPGVGTAAVTAIGARDYSLVQAVVLLVSGFFVIINLVVDLLYAWIDPRIRYA
ncbi:MAG: ABC transporter permease [Chloroflexi bacterium]|nr:ABC transporter permease [Chloroflexota bacterium]